MDINDNNSLNIDTKSDKPSEKLIKPNSLSIFRV